MSTPLDRFLKDQTDGPSGALTLEDWNGLVSEVGGALAELRRIANGADAATQEVIKVLLDRVNSVLGPAFDAIAVKAAQVDQRLALLNGAGVSADAVLPSASRVFVTPEQQAKIDTAAQAADLATVATVAGSIGARDLYLSGF